METQKFITNILADYHHCWKPGSKVFISAQPGRGKTTYIFQVLLKHAIKNNLEILFLSNRESLHRQILSEVCELFDVPYQYYSDVKYAEFPGITIATYQTIAEMLKENPCYNDIPYFHYLVMDEVHFFEEDSDFNAKIQRLLKWRNRIQCEVEIYLSATLDDVLIEFGYWDPCWYTVYEEDILTVRERFAKDLLRSLKGQKEWIYFYDIPREIPRCNIFVYDDVTDVVEKINSEENDDKWLLFQSNKMKAHHNVAKNIKVSKAVITADDKECTAMKEIIENKCFEEKVLITTKVLDNGVSIHDTTVKNILIETTSETEFIQMLGRRRIEEHEDVVLNLFIPRMNAGYFKSMIVRRIQPMLELTEFSQEELMKAVMDEEKYRDIKALFDVEDGRFVLNPIAKKRLHQRKKYFEKIIAMMETDKNYFVKEQLSWLGISTMENVTFFEDLKFQKHFEELKEILRQLTGVELDKDKQKYFRNALKLHLLELLPERFSQKDRIPGLNVINGCFKSLGLPYQIGSKSGKKKGEKTSWIITKI